MKAQKKSKRKPDKPLDRTKAEQFTCIICPTCCELETDGFDVNGARCPKGEAFARQEMVMPLRVITTTMRCDTAEGVRMIPVKTTSPVPMARIFEIMKGIKALRLSEVPAIGMRFTTGASSEAVEWVVTGELD
jgi:CxxC motif-containing protein